MSTDETHIRPWYVMPVSALAGMFLANGLPHMLAGPLILRLPTPFSGGPGTLSSPMVNVLWGLSNIAIGLLLVRALRPWASSKAPRLAVALGAAGFLVFLTWALGSLPLPDRFVP